MSRREIYLGLVPVVLLVGLFTARNLMWDPPPIPPAPEAPPSGISCFRAGGEPSYCRCLDRLDSARAEAGLPRAGGRLQLDHPAVRYALRHPHEYPIINSDTARCVIPPVTPTAPPRETA